MVLFSLFRMHFRNDTAFQNGTATWSARISHRDSETTGFYSERECCRPGSELFAQSLPSNSFHFVIFLARLEDPARSFVDLFHSCRFREISRRPAVRFIFPVVERGRAHLWKNLGETSVEKVPSMPAPTDWYDFIGPPRFIGAAVLHMIDLRRFVWIYLHYALTFTRCCSSDLLPDRCVSMRAKRAKHNTERSCIIKKWLDHFFRIIEKLNRIIEDCNMMLGKKTANFLTFCDSRGSDVSVFSFEFVYWIRNFRIFFAVEN